MELGLIYRGTQLNATLKIFEVSPSRLSWMLYDIFLSRTLISSFVEDLRKLSSFTA